MKRVSPGQRRATCGVVLGGGVSSDSWNEMKASPVPENGAEKTSIVLVVAPDGKERCLRSDGGNRTSFLQPWIWKYTFAVTS